MAMYASLHMDPDEPCEITCEHQLNGRRPEGYPVLAVGTLTIYPTRERLERLRAVISAYLAVHGEPDGSADEKDIMPIPAEAATGAAIDADDLLFDMAAGWGSPTVEELEAAGRNRPAGVP